jgi:excisionase family DNA binding protein
MNMDFAAPRTELSLGVRAREEMVRPMRGHKTYSHGGIDLQYPSRRTRATKSGCRDRPKPRQVLM